MLTTFQPALPLYWLGWSPHDQQKTLWDANVVHTEFYSGEHCLALPKLNLQFLTLHDYLLRSFNLFRLEANYEIREDLEDVIRRVAPKAGAEGSVEFQGAPGWGKGSGQSTGQHGAAQDSTGPRGAARHGRAGGGTDGMCSFQAPSQPPNPAPLFMFFFFADSAIQDGRAWRRR